MFFIIFVQIFYFLSLIIHLLLRMVEKIYCAKSHKLCHKLTYLLKATGDAKSPQNTFLLNNSVHIIRKEGK